MPRSVSSRKVKNAKSTTTSAQICITKNHTESCIKEVVNVGVETANVCHRKSERRRIARDIFLVFEEQCNGRRSRHCNKKSTKPKFGHLKVENPVKTKSLLQDIKNEPKCYLNNKYTQPATSKKIVKRQNTCTANSFAKKTPIPSVVDVKVDIKSNISSITPIAKVNPIFLWAKQDDTRIVEVRCEDYDKRNRIRITKTANGGWRAIPCTDPTSTKVVRFYTTPIMKVKCEKVLQTPLDNEIHFLSGNNNCLITSSVQELVTTKKIDVKSNLTEKKKQFKTKVKSRKRKKLHKTSLNVNKIKIPTGPVPPKIRNISMESSEEIGDSINILSLPASNDNKNHAPSLPSHSSNYSSARSSTTSPNANLNMSQEAPAVNTNQNNEEESVHLCPETGLFIPLIDNNNSDKFNNHNENYLLISDSNDEIISLRSLNTSQPTKLEEDVSLETAVETLECVLKNGLVECKKSSDDMSESLEAKTKNLKDLLDSADLLEHCDITNANNDEELIESLVKTSCESNLINPSKVEKEIPQQQQQTERLVSSVNELPKCLSFNEAGEIDFFQSNTCTELFAKCPEENPVTFETIEILPSKTTPLFNLLNFEDDVPKDLSYKKRNDICSSSESSMQCAVTSSSDIMKSPPQDTPAFTASTETLKNLVFEEFMKFNTQTHQPLINEPIDLGKRKSNTTKENSFCNLIEQVIVDHGGNDDAISNDNGMNNATPTQQPLCTTFNGSSNTKIAATLIDKDPDPYTQLQLLLRNTQWKVPDPILVPKDRLRAVLASPAREIPLLITTRPELKLPEAFAYPEIIQNPNILVISMAQLEAILKNNEVEKRKATNDTSLSHGVDGVNGGKGHKSQIHQPVVNDILQRGELAHKALNTNCLPSEEMGPSTLAMLHQMFWFPYFGQFSQDIMKAPETSLSMQQLPNFLPFYNPQASLKHLDNICKSYWKQRENTSNAPTIHHHHPSPLNMSTEASDISRESKYSKSQQNLINGFNSEALQKQFKGYLLDHDERKQKIAQQSMYYFQYPDRDRTKVSESQFTLNNTSVQRKENMKSSRLTKLNECSEKQDADKKPRLTCKSLANLLDPEYTYQNDLLSSSGDLLSQSDTIRDFNDKLIPCIRNGYRNIQTIDDFGLNAKAPFKPPEMEKEFRKQTLCTFDGIKTTNLTQSRISENSATTASDISTPLWHPLFGNNSKPEYYSPWQWTTVTAAGE